MSGRAPPGFSRHAQADDDGRDLMASQEGSSTLASGAGTQATSLPVDKLKWQQNLLECSSKADAKPLALLACGSFNPVTNQHLRMVELARYEMQHQVRSLGDGSQDGCRCRGPTASVQVRLLRCRPSCTRVAVPIAGDMVVSGDRGGDNRLISERRDVMHLILMIAWRTCCAEGAPGSGWIPVPSWQPIQQARTCRSPPPRRNDTIGCGELGIPYGRCVGSDAARLRANTACAAECEGGDQSFNEGEVKSATAVPHPQSLSP